MGLGSHLDDEALAGLRRLAVDQVAKPVAKPRAAEPKKPVKNKPRHKAAAPKMSVKKPQKVVISARQPKKQNRPAMQTDEDRRRNGLTPPRTGTTSVVKSVVSTVPVVASKRVEKAPAKFEVPKGKTFSPKPNARVSLGKARSRLAVDDKKIRRLCLALQIELLGDEDNPAISGTDFEKLRLHIARKNAGLDVTPASMSFEERLRGKYSAGAWNGEGSPLARYDARMDAAKKESAPKTGSVPYIKVVSGGLPTLGKGHH